MDSVCPVRTVPQAARNHIQILRLGRFPVVEVHIPGNGGIDELKLPQLLRNRGLRKTSNGGIQASCSGSFFRLDLSKYNSPDFRPELTIDLIENDVDMPSTKPPRDRKTASKPEVTDAAEKELLQQPIQKQERLAESRLEMAKLFSQNGKPRIAVRQLKEIVNDFGEAEVAREAKAMLKKLHP